MHVVITNIAYTTGDHDGLVISPDPVGSLCFERSEVACEIRPAELIVEGRRADRPLCHDI